MPKEPSIRELMPKGLNPDDALLWLQGFQAGVAYWKRIDDRIKQEVKYAKV